MRKKYLVLGSSGLVGRHVVQALMAGGCDVACATRHPCGAHDVHLDLLEPASFAAALRGASRVLLVSPPGDDQAHVHAQPFVDAARRAGVQRIVVLSALGAQLRPQSSLRGVELLVEQSGLAWTHVRPNFFMQTLARPPIAAEIAAHRTLSLPLASARIAYVDARDVVAVLHRALVDDRLAGECINVNGPHALTHEAIAQEISAAIGTRVRYLPLEEAAARERMLARGFEAQQVERALAFYGLIRQGFWSAVDAGTASLLGRPLRTWGDFARESCGAWRCSCA